uniref:helix-turn-helix domain-containing protein n=1 Tax=Bifidobacterium adolescentis TaxID=1680 RepID=UPI003FEDA1FB
MSVRAVSWACGLNLGSMTQKAVLLYLAYRAREEDDCAWPSVNLIQVETELSERAVRKALRELRDKGLIALGSGTRGGRLSWRRRSREPSSQGLDPAVGRFHRIV